MVTIPLAWFREQRACEKQVQKLAEQWGEEIPLTHESLCWAARAGLSLDWFTLRYLSPQELTQYNAHKNTLFWTGYAQNMSLLWDEYYPPCPLGISPPLLNLEQLAEYWQRADTLRVEHVQQVAGMLWTILVERRVSA